jgi:hypothetical protein
LRAKGQFGIGYLFLPKIGARKILAPGAGRAGDLIHLSEVFLLSGLLSALAISFVGQETRELENELQEVVDVLPVVFSMKSLAKETLAYPELTIFSPENKKGGGGAYP